MAQRLGNSVPDWPPFPDSADALVRLAKHYQPIILSNAHRDGFAGSNQRLRGHFAAIITAEDVRAYKPAEDHFGALQRSLGLAASGNLNRDRRCSSAFEPVHGSAPDIARPRYREPRGSDLVGRSDA